MNDKDIIDAWRYGWIWGIITGIFITLTWV
jgi:hypothetical protein